MASFGYDRISRRMGSLVGSGDKVEAQRNDLGIDAHMFSESESRSVASLNMLNGTQVALGAIAIKS